jgi:hypothetical protein
LVVAFFGLTIIMSMARLGDWEQILYGTRTWTSGWILATDTTGETNLCLWGLANKGSEANTLAIEPLPPIQSCMHPIGYEDGP